MAEELKSIKERASRIGLPHRVWSRLASEPNSIIYPQNVSNWLAGDATSESKVKRLVRVLEDVEALVAADPLKLDLTDAQNVRLALKRLADHKAAAAEVVTEVADEYDGHAVGADGILAGRVGTQQ